MRNIVATIAALAFVFSIVSTADAAWNASISGRVVDIQTMRSVPGATVKAFSSTGNRELGQAVSDANGSFVIHGLQGGAYRLVFQRKGFQQSMIGGVLVQPGELMIEAAPLAMYPMGAAVPQAVSIDPCGIVQPGQTADVYVVCSGD